MLEFDYGDRETFTISGLVDGTGATASLALTDTVTFTMRRYPAGPVLLAIDCTFIEGDDEANGIILPADWATIIAGHDITFVWDVEIDSDADHVVTVAKGDGIIHGDVTRVSSS